jgi:hypothetical protein
MILSEQQIMIRDMARQFAQEQLVPHAAEWDTAARFPQEAVDAMGALGLMGMLVPEEWGGTGAIRSGIAEPYSVLTPTYSFGQGFGGLPETMGWARPIAVTGQIGYQIPTRSHLIDEDVNVPQVLAYGGSVQYSMAYLKSEVQDLQLPDFINHLIPIVEAQFSTPVANNFGNSFVTTGTINPGVIWVGSYFQVGVEAIIPLNRDSGTARGKRLIWGGRARVRSALHMSALSAVPAVTCGGRSRVSRGS